jgi:hypothetical protein
MNPLGDFAMQNALTNSVRWSYRTWVHVALVASAMLVLGSAPAKANSLLYYNNRTIWAISTNDQWVRVKASGWVVPTQNRLTVQFNAVATGNNAGQFIRVVIYDHTGNYVSYADWRAPSSNEQYYAVFAVNPHQKYSVSLFVQDIQAFPPYSVFYNNYFEIWDGTEPWGTRID